MRIFVGIKISADIAENVLQWRRSSQSPILDAQCRWIEPKNLHTTLVPPWEISDEAWNIKREVLCRELRGVKFEPFEIKFNKIEFGPSFAQPSLSLWPASKATEGKPNHRPNLIWAIGQANEAINNLRLAIYQKLGQEPDIRPFRLHCTLARLKKFLPKEGEKVETLVDFRQEVRSFVLYRAHLLPQGADYEVLEEFKVED